MSKLLDHKDAILDALRTNKYRQARNSIASISDDCASYCCIGVAAKEAGMDVWEKRATAPAVDYLGLDNITVGKKSLKWVDKRFPEREYAAKPAPLSEILMALNDSAKWDFPDIAEFIEMVINEHIELQARKAASRPEAE